MLPPFKIHGGAYYNYKWILSHVPANYDIFIDGCVGAGSFLLNHDNKNGHIFEVASDLDIGVCAIWNLIQNRPHYMIKELNNLVTRFCNVRVNGLERLFNCARNALNYTGHEQDEYFPVYEFILRKNSRGGLKKDYSQSSRLRRGMNETLSSFLSSIDRIPDISQRIRDVKFHNQDIKDIIKKYNSENTFILFDPPWLPETRVSSTRCYDHEMSRDKHIDIILKLKYKFGGKAMIVGRPSKLYDKYLLNDWERKERCVTNHSGQGKIKNKTPLTIWMNY